MPRCQVEQCKRAEELVVAPQTPADLVLQLLTRPKRGEVVSIEPASKFVAGEAVKAVWKVSESSNRPSPRFGRAPPPRGGPREGDCDSLLCACAGRHASL
mgnify:CR=1 FL=1